SQATISHIDKFIASPVLSGDDVLGLERRRGVGVWDVAILQRPRALLRTSSLIDACMPMARSGAGVPWRDVLSNGGAREFRRPGRRTRVPSALPPSVSPAGSSRRDRSSAQYPAPRT